MRSSLGSIQRLGPDYYRVSIEGGRDKNGKRTRTGEYVRGTRQDAEIAIAKLLLANGKPAGDASGMKLSEAWEVYYRPTLPARLKRDTIKHIDSTYKAHIEPLFGDMKMASLTTRGIEQKILTVEKPYARDHTFRVMRAFVNQLWNWDLLDSNPFDKKMRVKPPRKSEQPVMGAGELAEWTTAMEGFIHEAAILLYPYAGLRRGEACALKTDDLRFMETDSGLLLFADIHGEVLDDGTYDDSKTERSDRTVVVAGYPAAQIRYVVAGMEPGWLVRMEDGRRATPHTFSRRYKEWCRKKGIPYYSIRQLRTTYATLSQASGVDATVTSRALGHTKLSMDYAHYFMANMPSQIAAAQAISNAVSSEM